MVIVMDKKTIVEAINKGIDDFNDQCMTMGFDSKAYHITNIEIEGMDNNYLIKELKDEIKQLKFRQVGGIIPDNKFTYSEVDEMEKFCEMVKGKVNIEININNMIECKTDREKMLCEQVLRMCRGEDSQRLVSSHWIGSDPLRLFVDAEYRAKPEKELIVPWDLINEHIKTITVTEKGITGYQENCLAKNYDLTMILALDLEGIDLPVTVKRT